MTVKYLGKYFAIKFDNIGMESDEWPVANTVDGSLNHIQVR